MADGRGGGGNELEESPAMMQPPAPNYPSSSQAVPTAYLRFLKSSGAAQRSIQCQ